MRRNRCMSVVVIAVLSVVGCAGEKEALQFPDTCSTPASPGVEWARCNLRGADLRGVDLSTALIHDVDLGGADLTGANLSDATLVNVFATDAIMKDATLEGAIVSAGDIHLAKYCNTTMPDGKKANGDC